MKTFKVLLVAVFAIASCCVTAMAANTDPKARLTEIKREIASIRYQNEQDVRKVSKECDDNIGVVKERFHKERDKFLGERKNELAKINKAFKDKMRPLEIEEKELMKIVSPEQGNFVKKRGD